MVLHSKSGDLRFIHLLPSPARGPDPGRAVGSEAVLGIGGVFARAGGAGPVRSSRRVGTNVGHAGTRGSRWTKARRGLSGDEGIGLQTSDDRTPADMDGCF